MQRSTISSISRLQPAFRDWYSSTSSANMIRWVYQRRVRGSLANGQEFQICVDGPAVPTNHDVRATFTVDGNEIEGFIHQPGKTTVCRVSHHEFDGVFYDRTLKFQRIVSVTTCFADNQTGFEDGPRPGVAEVGALGTILVDLEAGTLSSKRKALPATIENTIDTMDEKLILKGVRQQTKYAAFQR